MDVLLPIAIGALFAASLYLLLGRDLLRVAIGLLLLGVAANVLIFVAGRAGSAIPAIVPPGASVAPPDSADPLPQALILTAIVISFGLFAFALVLFRVAARVLGGLDSEAPRLAEPARALEPPPAPAEAHRRSEIPA